MTYFSILYLLHNNIQRFPMRSFSSWFFYTLLRCGDIHNIIIMLININLRISFSLIRQHRHAENRLKTKRAMNVLSDKKWFNINNKTYSSTPIEILWHFHLPQFHTHNIIFIVALYDIIISYSGYFEKKNK